MMKNILTLTEIIFKGTTSKINFKFLKDLISKSDQVRFNFPEVENNDYNFIINLLRNNEYADIAFDSFKFNLATNVFVNLVLDRERIELLFFLDLKNISCNNYKESVDKLIVWAKEFELIYHFDEIRCQPDNAEEDEFYFKGEKYGFLYDKLIN